MGKQADRALGQRLVHGCWGAFLAMLAALSSMFWWTDINWWIVGISAVFGFLLAGFLGEEAIDFLKSLWWWT
jgi:hypothetical protein